VDFRQLGLKTVSEASSTQKTMVKRGQKVSSRTAAIATVAALIAFTLLFVPPVRQALVFYSMTLVAVACFGTLAFQLFRHLAKKTPTSSLEPGGKNASQMETSFRSFNLNTLEALAENKFISTTELIEKLRSTDWFQFEKVVQLLFQKHGYTVSQRGGANPDVGIDLIMEKDGARKAIQCKQWKQVDVGVKPVREFAGAMLDEKVSAGIFVTLCAYSTPAKEYADRLGIEMLDETGLAELLEAVDAKADPQVLEFLNDQRKYCPKCESEMVLRTAKDAPTSQFWGCSAFPRCDCTLQIS
jgi:HJR/Mrr/RecB family endonuclease